MINSVYHRSQFLTSAASILDAPADLGAEVAFAGRSNAGKSSALNAIVAQKSLARTSKTPGRTQLLNFFSIDDQRRLVDLPGYGYAKVSASRRGAWHRAVERYLSERQCLRGVFLVMDIRHPLMPFDQLMLDWCRGLNLPAHVLLTKADKLGRGAAKTTLLQTERQLRELGEHAVTVQVFSSFAHTGIEEAHRRLDKLLAFSPGRTA